MRPRRCRNCGAPVRSIATDATNVDIDPEPLNVLDPFPPVTECYRLYVSTPFGWHQGPRKHTGHPIFRAHRCPEEVA
jgi:hypothetical protein